MTPRRRLLAAASVGIALVGLTGCQQPTPIVTLQSGRTVVTSEAQTWCFGGKPNASCRDQRASIPAVQMRATPGQLVSIDVSKQVAERGWFAVQEVPGIESQNGAYPTRDDHYFTLTMPPATVQLTIRALDGERDADGEYDRNRVTGLWTFVVTPED